MIGVGILCATGNEYMVNSKQATQHSSLHFYDHKSQETAELRLKLDNSQGDVRNQLKEKDDKIGEILEELASINALYNELKETSESVSVIVCCCTCVLFVCCCGAHTLPNMLTFSSCVCVFLTLSITEQVRPDRIGGATRDES